MKRVLIFMLIITTSILMSGCTSDATTSTTQSTDSSSSEQKSTRNEYSLNQDIYVKNSSGEYRLKFTGIRETSDRNEYSDVNADRVVIISYEYENISKEDDLYISDIDFKVYDKQGNILETYPVDYKYSDSIGPGRKTTAEAAYALNSIDNYLELEYYDNMFNSKSDCLVKIEW